MFINLKRASLAIFVLAVIFNGVLTNSSQADNIYTESAHPEPITSILDHRPNIVLISADDMRAEEIQYMPHTRRLLEKEGVSFTDALSPHPLCCPARAELLTGQYAQNNGVLTNWGSQGGYKALDPSSTIATWLSSSGYNTGFVGKYLNAVDFEGSVDPGWTLFNPTMSGYSDYYDFIQYDQGRETRVTEQYYTDYVKDESVNYVKTLSAYQAPFFLWVSHFGPHSTRDGGAAAGSRKSAPVAGPAFAVNAKLRSYARKEALKYFKTMKNKPSYNEANMDDKHESLNREKIDNVAVKRILRGRIAALYSVDQAVKEVVETLEKTGELDNTYIAFITDNGHTFGEHRQVGKILPFEENFQTPLLIRGPGIDNDVKISSPVTILDLAPTWLEIADTKSELTLDGKSLLSLAKNKNSTLLHPGGILVQAGPEQRVIETDWYYKGVRTQRYTYVEYFDGWRELYDRQVDPYQTESFINDERYAEVAKSLAERVEALKDCQGLECNQDFAFIPKPK